MDSTTYYAPFFDVLVFAGVGLVFIVATLLVSKILRPARPNVEKNASYESGEEALGSSWPSLNPKFYVLALVFILFEVEIIVMFLWAPVFMDARLMAETNNQWAWATLVEIFIFVLILAVGLAYAWRNGHLDWVTPTPPKSSFKSVVPKALYDKVNERYGK